MDRAAFGRVVVDLHTHVLSLAGAHGCYVSPRFADGGLVRILRWLYGIPADPPEEADRRIQQLCIREAEEAQHVQRVVILGIDAVYAGGEIDWRRTSFYVPNAFLFHLVRQSSRFWAGVSIHPDRKDAFAEMDRCLEQGAVLMKWLPNVQGIDPADRRWRPFYRKLVDAHLPLLSHTGPEHSLPALDQSLGRPERLRLPLEEGVTVIAAHGGGSERFFSGRTFDRFIEMLMHYPNLYADTSAMTLPLRMGFFRRMLAIPEIYPKLVHGSDFPLPVFPWGFLGKLPLRTLRRLGAVKNRLDRDLLLKEALGLPRTVFERGGELIRCTD